MRLFAMISVPGEATAAGDARRFVRDVLKAGRLGVDAETLGDIGVCVSELTTNAYEHTASGRGGEVTVAVSAARRTLRVTVIDNGNAATEPYIRDDPAAENGRGLRLVRELSTRWDVDHLDTGTAVWAEFPCPTRLGPSV